jgi:LysM repeat protein
LPNRAWSDVSRVYRYGFQNQEKDDEIYGESNSISFKYRLEDTRTGKFLSIDPLNKKYPFYSSFAFSGNRVIDAVEIEGLEPGVLFSSADAAAQNFAELFNDNSIRDNREYGTKIYTVTIGPLKQYSYAIPVVGQLAGITNVQMALLVIPARATVTDWAHTHGASTESALETYDDNVFSGTAGTPAIPATATTPEVPAVDGTDGDIGWSEVNNLNGYVATPNGSLIKYDITSKAITTLSTSMPSDSGLGTGGAGISSASTSTYNIKYGDTLSSIAARYKTTIKAIQNENGLKNSKIKAGGTLTITN